MCRLEFRITGANPLFLTITDDGDDDDDETAATSAEYEACVSPFATL